MDVVASIQLAMESLGKLRELSKRIEDAEFKMALADLAGSLADAKMEVAELKQACARLTEECNSLQARLHQREVAKPALKEGLYAFEGEDGLFCTRCFDVAGQKIRVAARSSTFVPIGKWYCPACKSNYTGR